MQGVGNGRDVVLSVEVWSYPEKSGLIGVDVVY